MPVLKSAHPPKNLDLRTIRLPLPGIVSILHRVSGVLLFVGGIPLFLSLLDHLLHPQAEGPGAGISPFIKGLLALLLWAFIHHFCAGIRFLLLDIHRGTDIAQARSSSRWVMVISLGVTLLVEGWLW
ncbi:MAG: succinate dehydrogenase, cytochrome b556 subunit [Ferrovum sp.]|nr:succinate dehydrogenase, cytochrome b556 subunit [Ferrovum sp.]NDU87495.1 succinate dehydrogenase, cytochrome b556 subunit [Ferrovum sp.]